MKRQNKSEVLFTSAHNKFKNLLLLNHRIDNNVKTSQDHKSLIDIQSETFVYLSNSCDLFYLYFIKPVLIFLKAMLLSKSLETNISSLSIFQLLQLQRPFQS